MTVIEWSCSVRLIGRGLVFLPSLGAPGQLVLSCRDICYRRRCSNKLNCDWAAGSETQEVTSDNILPDALLVHQLQWPKQELHTKQYFHRIS